MQMMDILQTVSDPLPEVILLDINMPKKNGLDCLVEIRKHEGDLKEVPVIILSTSSHPANIEKAKELGASFYAVKPNRFDILKSFLEEILKMDWSSSENKDRKFRII